MRQRRRQRVSSSVSQRTGCYQAATPLRRTRRPPLGGVSRGASACPPLGVRSGIPHRRRHARASSSRWLGAGRRAAAPAGSGEDREVRRPGPARQPALAPQFRERAPRTAVTAVSSASLSGAAGPAASIDPGRPPFPTNLGTERKTTREFPRGQLERSEQARKTRRGFHLRRPRGSYQSIRTRATRHLSSLD